MRERVSLDEAVSGVWSAFGDAVALPSCVSPSLPILFFGDLHAYFSSRVRVLTVGLNSSLHEFPADSPFRRFPLAEGVTVSESDRYLDALSAYYRTDPYRGWFSAFEPLLNGAGASYYAGRTSTAVHTDICSPVATDPTWSQLGDADRSALESDGCPLWHVLLKALKPQAVVLSVAKRYLGRVEFEPLDNEWNVIHTFDRTGSGSLRSRPYEVLARWYDVGGEPSLFVFGPAAQTPFGIISDPQKGEVGAILLEAYRDGR